MIGVFLESQGWILVVEFLLGILLLRLFIIIKSVRIRNSIIKFDWCFVLWLNLESLF